MSVTDLLPSRRVEAWKYSDLRAAVGDAPPPIAPAPMDAPPRGRLFSALAPVELAFEGGRLALWPDKKSGGGPWVRSKADPDPPRSLDAIPLGRLAASSSPDEWMPIIEAGDAGGIAWVRFIGRADPVSAHARVGIVVGPGQSLELVETFEGDAPGFSNVLIEAFVGEGGSLRRTVLQRAGDKAVQVSTAQISLERDAAFSQFVLAEGAKLARIETHVNAAASCRVSLNGVYLASAGRHADLTSVIGHHEVGGHTDQLIKGVARKGGRGVFQGKIVVAPHAQKTDARQYHHGMLLEEGAEILAKPELLIHADDVQCAHGNTAGGLDERALFYLRSRGVPEAEARALLIEGFLVDAVPEALPADVREEILGRIRAWLSGGAA